MEQFDKKDFNISTLMKIYYKPEYSNLFNKIKEIKTPVKNDILMALLDGNWHSENDLLKITKKQYHYMGIVTLGSMVYALNHCIKNNYLDKKCVNGTMFYKISDNYVGLTRAAFTKYRFMK